MIQTNRQTGSVFQASVEGSATFKEALLAPREALTKAGCAKCTEGVKGKK